MARAGIARRAAWMAIALYALSARAQEIPRSGLLAEEQRLLDRWTASARADDLDLYLQIEGYALRERRRRAERMRRALAGELGEDPQELARRIRALEIELSEHALIDPYQYILDFRDPSNRIEVAPHPSLDLRDAYTVSLWLYMEGGARAWETKLYSHSDVNDNKFNVMLEGRYVELLIWSDRGQPIRFRSDEELPLREWVHLVVGYARGRGVDFHLNGHPWPQRQIGGDATFPPLRADPEQELYIGCLDRCIPGSVDDVRVYDRPLDFGEIADLAAGKDLREGLVAHWPLDEREGATAHNLVEPAANGRVGASVRRGVAPPPTLTGTAYGFSGKARAWSDKLMRIETELDSLELRLLIGRPEVDAAVALSVPDEATLLIYLPQRRGVHVVADAGAKSFYVSLPELELPRWREELLRRGRRLDDRAWRELARSLAVALWDPVAERLVEEAVAAREIWLSLPGELRALPFSALVDANGAYLQESIAFARVGPLSGVRSDPITARGEAVLIGNPDFRSPRGKGREQPWDADDDAEGNERLARCFVVGPLLHGTHLELQRLELLFASRNAARLEWYDAYVSVLEQRMPGAGVIHLATHGYRLDADCAPRLPLETLEWSGLKLGGSDLLRGDSVEHEDRGFLSAAGLARLDLRGTQLIFFSGCETAVQHEGSLAEAAWLAGARCSVGTLAAIDDGLTPVLAERFHAQWMEGNSPAEALRAAREALRKHLLNTRGRAHPAAWAPFVLEGL